MSEQEQRLARLRVLLENVSNELDAMEAESQVMPCICTHDGSERGIDAPLSAACDDDPPSRAVA